MTHWILLVHVDLCRQDGHGRTAAGALAGAGPEVLLAGVGTVPLQGAPGAGGTGQDPGRPLPQPWPGPRPRSLTASPGHTSHSRRPPHPRSPRRWCARHRQQLSPWPSGSRGEGIGNGRGHRGLFNRGKVGKWGFPAEVVRSLGGGRRGQWCSCWEAEGKKASKS